MNRTLLFDSPFLLGFDHTRNLIERAAKAAGEGYPPYNVEELGDGRVRITLAVAGFTPAHHTVVRVASVSSPSRVTLNGPTARTRRPVRTSTSWTIESSSGDSFPAGVPARCTRTGE